MPATSCLLRRLSDRRLTLTLKPGACVLLAVVGSGCAEPWSPAVRPEVPVASVRIVTDNATLREGATLQLVITVRDSSEAELSGRTLSIYSTAPDVASVTQSGKVEAKTLGVARIVAASEGMADTVVITVRLQFRTISAGAKHTCAVSATHRVYCWGEGALGRVGDGLDRSTTLPVAGDTEFRFHTVSAGGESTCGLTGFDALCWGSNGARQLGSGTKSDAATPTRVAGDHAFSTLAINTLHTCGITLEGAAYCWGADWAGQIGNGSVPSEFTPVAVVGGFQFVSIAPGWLFTCGISNSGSAHCWGFNELGQLGTLATDEICQWPNGTPVPCSTDPVTVSGNEAFRSLTAGSGHACALTAEGRAYCWGDNRLGQRGDGSTNVAIEPTEVVGNLVFVHVTGGDRHTCGLTTDGEAYCWGYNGDGALGTDASFDSCNGMLCSTRPVLVRGGLEFQVVDASSGPGGSHTCGVTRSGLAFCWGLNDAGQLGAGYRGGISFAPLLVAGQLVSPAPEARHGSAR